MQNRPNYSRVRARLDRNIPFTYILNAFLSGLGLFAFFFADRAWVLTMLIVILGINIGLWFEERIAIQRAIMADFDDKNRTRQ